MSPLFRRAQVPTHLATHTKLGRLSVYALRCGHVERHPIPDPINPGRVLTLRMDGRRAYVVTLGAAVLYRTTSLNDARKHVQTTLRRFALLGHP
jgi:hypothetical protein